MKVIYFKFWTVADVKDRPDHLFIFGDNNVKRGKGGQAIIRDEPNAMGIPTKKFPNNRTTSFYSDDELEENQENIDQAIKEIIEALPKYEVLVLPEDGFGTGLAQLPKKAPKTYAYVKKKVQELINSTSYVRHVPPMNSNSVKMGTKMKGNDGNLYQSVENVDGARSWKLIMKCDGESCTFIPDTKDQAPIKKPADQPDPEAEDELQKLLPRASDQWTVYGASYCGWCRRAVELLNQRDEVYRYIDLSPYKMDLFRLLRPKIGTHRTIPMVFNRESFIGGYTELRTFLS